MLNNMTTDQMELNALGAKLKQRSYVTRYTSDQCSFQRRNFILNFETVTQEQEIMSIMHKDPQKLEQRGGGEEELFHASSAFRAANGTSLILSIDWRHKQKIG